VTGLTAQDLQRITACLARSGRLTAWEASFLQGLQRQAGWTPTEKQLRILIRIEEKLGIPAQDAAATNSPH
jgi:hypothetical protein